MPRYYCDYCDTYLTHDAPSVRKQHNAGYKHKGNVRNYYQQYEAQLNQSLIDQKVKEHLGAYRPVAAPYPPLRPGLSLLPNPMGVPGGPQMPPGAFIPGMRPPVLPRPMLGGPGYGGPPQMHQMVGPPGMPPFPGQMNGLPRPVGGPPLGSGGMPPPPNGAQPGMPQSSGGPPMGMPPSSGGPPMYMHSMYQGNASAPTSGSGDSSTQNAQVSEDSH